MKPQFIPDLQDWSGSFAGSASIVTDANFAWAWNDGAQEVAVQDVAAHDIAAAGVGVAADMSLLSPDIDAGILQATGNGDAMALGPVEISDGNLPLPVSDAAPIASEDGSAAPAVMSFAMVAAGSASPGSAPGALASPAIVPVAAHAPDAGPGYSDPSAAVAHPDAQIFFTSLPTALPVNGGAPAALSVALETAHAAPDLSAGPVLANPATPVEVSQNPITDASIGAHGATAAQVQQALDESGLSVNGAGIKVGVLSNSFDDLGKASIDEADGALPSSVQVIEDQLSGGDDEGRAMLQVVHDIAPGASLAFYTATESEQDFANGILALAAAGCKIICDDVRYFDEPFFGGGVVAQAIQTVEAEGVTYITDAGNDASNAYQAAWTPTSGTFDGRTITNAQNFGGSIVQTITVGAGATSTDPVPLIVEWNQPYGSAAVASLDVYLFHNGSFVAEYTNVTNNPWIGVPLNAAGTYQVVIASDFGYNPGFIKEIVEGNGLPVTISGANSGTVFGHGTTPGVITVGAVSTADTPAFGFGTPVSETFSSSGAGTELLYNADGTALSSPVMINPVAVSSVDNISTTVSGSLGDFYGTSAASASLAGVAALILAANPNLTPAQVEQIMEETATPMSNSAVSGAGLVNVDAAVAAAQALLPPVTIEAFGSTSLEQVGNHFYFEPVGGSGGPEFKYNGSPVAAGEYEWSYIGAEQTSTGYEVALHVAGTDQYTVWNTDANGNFVSNGTGGVVVSGSSAVLELLEPSFHQDLNGDGVIGAPNTVIESFGSTSLVQVANNFYFEPVGGSGGPEFKYNGSPVAVGEYDWSYIGAEQTSTGYEVALHVPGTDQYTVWNTDANGNFVSNGTGGVVVSGSSAVLELLEPSFHQDLNGDGVIGAPNTVIESFGSTSLVQVANNFYFEPVGGSGGPEFKYNGSPVAVGEYQWSYIGAEQTSTGYEVALHVPGTDQYTVWNTDANGNFVSNGTGGVVVSGSSAVLELLEPSFHQDLNGDGVVGAPNTVIESFGSTSLVQVANNFYFEPVGGSGGPEFKYNGSPVSAGEYEWSYIGAEQTSTGYEVALHVAGTDQYTVWNTDTNGNFVSNGTGGVVVSGSSAILESLEPSFHQDLNGDGTIGVVSQNSSVISMAVATATGSTGHDNFVFHPALGQQPSANPGPSGTIAPEELAHFTNGNQAAGFWSDNHAGNAQTSLQPAHDGQGETADAGNHDLANALSVHHAEFMHAYLIH